MSITRSRRARWGVSIAALALAGATATSCLPGGDDPGRADGPTTTSRPSGGPGSGTVGTTPVGTTPVGTEPTTTEPPTTVPVDTQPPTTPAPPTTRPTTTRPANPGGPVTGGGTAECPNLEIVTARGTGESQTSAGGLAGLDQGIASQVPGTTIYQVVYPASTDFANSPPVGTQDALAHMNAKANQCPNTRFFLTGYSQGAMVMTRVFQNPGNLTPLIIGGVLYGNPFYKGNSPTAAGPDVAAMGVAPGGIPASWGGKVHDYCAQGDNVCGSGGGGAAALAQGISAAHLSYPRSALERDATAWAVGLIKGT